MIKKKTKTFLESNFKGQTNQYCPHCSKELAGSYYLFIVALKHCPYSEAAIDLVKKHNISHDILIVTADDKDKYKTEEISTFPQVYLKKHGSYGSLLLGGFSDLEFAHNFIKTITNENLEQKYNEFGKKKNWNKKQFYRLVELFKIK